MTDAHQLIDTLKKLLRARDLTYAMVAARVGLSEASVKRLFSAETFTLKRLETFCRLLDVDFFELARLARSGAAEVREMTTKQEAALAGDARLLGVFYLLLSDWKAGEIFARYQITRAELTRLLVRLDRLALIDLLPEDRVRVKVPTPLRLRPGGPIDAVYGRRVISEFAGGGFARGDFLRFEYRELSKASSDLLQRKLDRLAGEFLELADLDSTLPASRRASTGLLLAMRPWSLSVVTGLRQREN